MRRRVAFSELGMERRNSISMSLGTASAVIRLCAVADVRPCALASAIRWLW